MRSDLLNTALSTVALGAGGVALAQDTEPRVREEAAESLGFFLDVSRAKAALEHGMHDDAAKGVRRAAERSLEGKNS